MCLLRAASLGSFLRSGLHPQMAKAHFSCSLYVVQCYIDNKWPRMNSIVVSRYDYITDIAKSIMFAIPYARSAHSSGHVVVCNQWSRGTIDMYY